MAATLYNLIVKGCSICYAGALSEAFKSKLHVIAGNFSTIEGFKSASISDLNGLRTIEGERCFRPLTPKEENAIISFQSEVDPGIGIVRNFIKILTKEFVVKQIAMLSSISIETFNANPILCTALNLKTPEEFVRYNAYQAIGRSIVTSMGFLVQNLLLYSNEFIFDGKNYEEGGRTKWDLVIDRLGEVKSFLEIKSGFNDMDAAQVKHYGEEIRRVEKDGHRGYIGITYGKKAETTVTAGLLKTYLNDWEQKTLVGKELWDFISGNENYHTVLVETIDKVANTVLHNFSIVQKIEERIAELIHDFESRYRSLEEYYESLW